MKNENFSLEFTLQEKLEIITHKQDFPNFFELLEKRNAWINGGDE